MNKFKLSFSVIICASLFFSSCKKDEIIETETENYKGIFVINEGGFNKSNGSLGLFKPGTKAYLDAFKKANNRPLGDVVQAMNEINSNYYIVVNNSNKIEVVKKSNFTSIATITTSSPRFVLKVGTSKAYISNFYDNSIKVLDLNNNQITSNVNINASSDQMALLDSIVYITTLSDKIMVLNSKNDVLIDSIPTKVGLSKIVNIGTSRIAALSSGSVDWNTGTVLENGKIYIFNKDSTRIERSFDLNNGSYGGSLIYNASTGLIYFNLGDSKIYSMNLNGVVNEFTTLPGGASVYGLSVGLAGEIYATDAGDFSSAGKVFVFDTDGSLAYSFVAGIAPSGVVINQ